jgi:DNA replication licensing factor MCM3
MEASEALEKFKEFLTLKQDEIESCKKDRIIINLNDLRQFSKDLSATIIKDPSSCLPWFEEEIKDSSQIKKIGFSGSFGLNSLSPRTVSSSFIGKMISLDGIVTSASLVRPKILKSVHFCDAKNIFYEKEYRDSTMITKLPPTNTIFPLRDMDSNKLTTEFGLSNYADFQTIVLQEMPENSPPGQLPRSIECILTDDLVDSVKPGDRIRIFGIFKSFCFGNTQFPSSFKTVLIVNNLSLIKNKESPVALDLSKLNLLASSNLKFKAIAPTIYGHDDIKKALALLMVGGNEIIMKNGSKIRGDINILLIGDPSTAKSQMLRYTLNFMPLSIATTGKGSSGVGLTAAVVVDKDTGDKRLEAGAMVLADRGVVCIDEFDKMSDIDRVAIHEVMEQQTVTIAKAGIHTTLNARCSVLAAANPIFGCYNEKMTAQENVRLPESLMTRFDLVFVTLDHSSVDIDNRISSHVLKMHTSEEKIESEISQELFKEFIMHAKSLRPKLGREAASLISKEYTKLRQRKNDKSLLVNITPRLLETMIRLSTAHAKLRLSELVEEQDAIEIINIINNNLIKKAPKANPAKKVKKEENISLGQELKEAAKGENKDVILEAIWKWKESNVGETYCEIKELAIMLDIKLSDVESVVEELSAQDIIMYDDGKIYFLD